MATQEITKVYQVHVWVFRPKRFNIDMVTDRLSGVLITLTEQEVEVMTPIVFQRGQKSPFKTLYVLRFRVQTGDSLRSDEVVGHLSRTASRLKLHYITTNTALA